MWLIKYIKEKSVIFLPACDLNIMAVNKRYLSIFFTVSLSGYVNTNQIHGTQHQKC